MGRAGQLGRRRFLACAKLRSRHLLGLQLVCLVVLALVSVRSLVRKIALDRLRKDVDVRSYGFVDGVPSPACRRPLPASQLVARALDAFRVHAPASVMNVSMDFWEWESYISGSESSYWRSFTNAFWTFRPGLTIVDIGDGTPRSPHLVTYIRVWKSANDFIRFNMVKAAGPGAKDVSTKLGSFVAGGRLRPRAVDVLHRRGSKVFTFVRSPISHFVSGYNEVEFRWMHEFVGNYSTVVIPEHCQAKGCVFHRFPIGSTDRVWAFLGDLLLGKLALLREVQHVYPQLGALPRGLPLDYVGRLESFDADWRYVLDTYIRTDSGSPQEYEFDPRVGAHNSTNYEAGAAAKRLVESDVGFVKVLEELFVLEYMCWGYEPIGSQGPRLHLRSI